MREHTIEISKVDFSDVDLLRIISVQTFTETFSGQNTESDMQKYIAENMSTEKLEKELTTEGSEFYFLKFENEVIGYLKLNNGNAQTEIQEANSLEIERIYVSKKFQGKHYGKLLLEKSIERATKKQYDYIWLGVWEKNIQAIKFYTKYGFIAYNKHIFKLGNDEQTDVLMKLNLT